MARKKFPSADKQSYQTYCRGCDEPCLSSERVNSTAGGRCGGWLSAVYISAHKTERRDPKFLWPRDSSVEQGSCLSAERVYMIRLRQMRWRGPRPIHDWQKRRMEFIMIARPPRYSHSVKQIMFYERLFIFGRRFLTLSKRRFQTFSPRCPSDVNRVFLFGSPIGLLK